MVAAVAVLSVKTSGGGSPVLKLFTKLLRVTCCPPSDQYVERNGWVKFFHIRDRGDPVIGNGGGDVRSLLNSLRIPLTKK